MKLNLTLRNQVHLLIAISFAILFVRLLGIYLLPFYDTTESRYGEIARIMLDTGNYITPQFNYDVPFWGKPPLHTWLSSLGFSIFGVNEFGGRIFHFILSLATVGLVAHFVKHLTQSTTKMVIAITVLISTIGFTIAVGMVMTESALIFCTTLAIISYWNHHTGHNEVLNGYLVFVALALGLLVKGPVACVIIGLAIFNWCLLTRDFKQLLTLPWVSGLALMLAISAPWYILAELATPGFLEYFIVGEHIERFLVSGWQGDLYGSAHKQAKGMIWLFWLAIAFPWSFVIFYQFVTSKTNKKPRKTVQAHPHLNKYLICCIVAPLILFTFASNILPIYGIPTIASLSILIALNIQRMSLVIVPSTVSLLFLLTVTVYMYNGAKDYKTDKYLLSELSETDLSHLYQINDNSFSARFYTKGKIRQVTSILEIPKIEKELFILATHQVATELSKQKACRILKENKRKLLLTCQEK